MYYSEVWDQLYAGSKEAYIEMRTSLEKFFFSAKEPSLVSVDFLALKQDRPFEKIIRATTLSDLSHT